MTTTALSLLRGASVERDDRGVRLRAGATTHELGPLPGPLSEALAALAERSIDEVQLLEGVREAAGAEGLLRFHALLEEIDADGWLCRTLLLEDAPLITVESISAFRRHRSAGDPEAGSTPLRLSRFALLRRDGERAVLESPAARHRFVLHDPRVVELVARFLEPTDPARLDLVGLPAATTRALVDRLVGEGYLVGAGVGSAPDEDRLPPLAWWEPHDLLAHRRGRSAGPGSPYGGVHPFLGRLDPEPALRPLWPGERIELARPGLERLRADDPPFTAVLEERRSLRAPGPDPITIDQLGELLYRAARVRALEEGEHQQVTRRPYPGGGAAYELEIYPVVGRCEGLGRGLYHYDPRGHVLVRVREDSRPVAALLASAAATAGAPAPDVLLVLGARFGRVMWKYRAMAYAGILKDVGVLFQTLYLAATAMGLSACALGGGDADRFAEATGNDPLVEGSVGEMIVNAGTGADGPSRETW